MLAELYLRSRLAAVPAIPPPVHTEHEIREWFASVVLPNRDVWLIAEREQPVALLVLRGEWIDQLYVDPTRTSQGLGAALIEVAKRTSPGCLALWTFQANTAARRFYERHGFVAVSTTDGDNEERAPDVHYRWSPQE